MGFGSNGEFGGDSSGDGGAGVGQPVADGTAGSVLFVGADGNLAQDNTGLHYDDSANQLKITSGAAANQPLRIQLAASQSGDAVQVLPNGSATPVHKVNATGDVFTGGVYMRSGATHLNFGNVGLVSFARISNASGFLDVSYGVNLGSSGTYTSDTGITRVSANTARITNGAAGYGNLQVGVLYLNDGTVKEVTYGAADSGGAGFKVLRIPN